MTLQEILNMILMKYPHSYESSQIVTILNDAQRRIFRTLYKPVTNASFDLMADNPFYPVFFPPESIIDVVVNGDEYPSQNIKYASPSHYYYITEDNCIGIYPTPTKDVSGGLTVFYYKEPTLLSATDLGTIPDLDAAWHMLLVNHACREISLMARDDMYKTFDAEITELERQYHRSNRARPHQIQDVYGVGRSPV